MREWIADYHVQRPLDEPGRPGRRFVARPPARLGLPDQQVVIELSRGRPADVFPAVSRWASAAAEPGGSGAPGASASPDSGLVIPLEAGPSPTGANGDPGELGSEDGGSRSRGGASGGPPQPWTWVSRRVALAVPGTAIVQPLAILAGAAAGLASLHAAGELHGHLTSGRLLPTTTSGALDLPDELAPPPPGLVTSVFSTETLDAMAPEVARGEPPTSGSDVWSLGACLYRALTGHLVHPGLDRDPLLTAMQRVIFERPDLGPGDAEVEPGGGRDVMGVAAACLAPDPGDRPAAAEVAASLARTVSSAG